MSGSVGLAIVGGRRGGAFQRVLSTFSEGAELVAACDLDQDVLASWRERHPGIRTYAEYQQLLADPEVDAVLIATPLHLHAQQSIEALEHGKHVLCEVTAATTIDECWALVEAVERTGLVYMMAENYCYTRPNMMILNMVQHDVFGPITHAEGAYIHDCRALMHDPKGNLTWRGKIHRDWNCCSYPTHSLGPVSQWLGVNRLGGDQLEYLVSCASSPRSVARHFRETFGPDHPGATEAHWHHGDSQVTVIHTVGGACIVLRVDWSSARPHNMTHYVLQGSTAAYLAPRYGKEEPLIWIDGRSPQTGKDHSEWESLWAYAQEYEHPYWQARSSEVGRSGHGSGDLFVLYDFLRAVQEGVRPAIDVYDAVTWSAIAPLSAQSLEMGGVAVRVPDFTRGQLQ